MSDSKREADPDVARSRPRSPAWALGLVAVAFAGGALVGVPTVPAPTDRFATLNGVEVTYAAFYEALQDYAGRDIAEHMLVEKALQQEAERLGLEPTVEEIEARIQELITERFGGSVADFGQWMVEEGAVEDSVRRRIASELRDIRVRSQGVEVTEERLREYFEAHREERYDRPPAVRYRRVVLATQEQARDILAKIKSGELDFFGAALHHSIDPAAEDTGGLVGPVALPLLKERAKGLYEALEKLNVYEFTQEPVEHDGAWHLMLLVERIDGKPRSYEEVKSAVRRDYLEANAKPDEEYYSELLERTRVRGLPDRYRIVELSFGTGAPATGGE